jgi:hypothetical protein
MSDNVIKAIAWHGKEWEYPKFQPVKQEIRDMTRFTNAPGVYEETDKTIKRLQAEYGITNTGDQDGMGRGLQCARDIPGPHQREFRALARYTSAVLHCFYDGAYDKYFHTFGADIRSMDVDGITVYMHIAAAVDTVTKEPIAPGVSRTGPDAQYANHSCQEPAMAELAVYCPYPNMIPILLLVQKTAIPAGPITIHYGDDFVMPREKVPKRLPGDQCTQPCLCAVCSPLPDHERRRMRDSKSSSGPSACLPVVTEWMGGPVLPPLTPRELAIMMNGGQAPRLTGEEVRQGRQARAAKRAADKKRRRDDDDDYLPSSEEEQRVDTDKPKPHHQLMRIEGVLCEHYAVKSRCPRCNSPQVCCHGLPPGQTCFLCGRPEPPPSAPWVQKIVTGKPLPRDAPDAQADSAPPCRHGIVGSCCFLCGRTADRPYS